jgi:hypothetical protein
MQRLNAASCLLFAILSGAMVCRAAERVNVQVVQTHTGILLGLGGVEGVPVLSRCTGISGRYTRELGFHCSNAPLAPPVLNQALSDYAFFYDLRVVLPNATRILYHCSTVMNTDCQGFPGFPEDTAIVCSDFVFAGRAYKDCTATGSAGQNIGVYQAALHGDRMTIFGPHWRRNYLQHGTWQLETAAVQDPKPVPPQEARPSSPPDPKPAQAPDASPASPTDANPPSAGTATAESNNSDISAPRLSPSITEPIIDPRVIEQAKAGDQVAQYKLGYDYFLGRGVPIDYVQAAIWWRKAADQGYPQAQNNLGVLYNAGKGVPQSYAEAYFWQNLAAARANGEMQDLFAKNRDESASRLWLLSRLKVQQRAAKWAADHPVPPRAHEPPPDQKRGEYP